MIINPQNIPDVRFSQYPEQFQHLVAGRVRKHLGDAVGLKNFGVNLTTLEPGNHSALRHWHTTQDEFIYIVAGEVTLVTDEGSQILKPGMMAGFPAGEADGHHLINHTDAIAIYLEVGDRTAGDQVTYPDDDMVAKSSSSGRFYTHLDGRLYSG